MLAGKGEETFTPQFTFHGFRYAEVTGLKAAPGKDAVTALVIHTDAPFAAELKTGSAMINKLWSNIEWGQRSNFVGVPTDCPQRDERLGWMADAQVFWADGDVQHGPCGVYTEVCRGYARDAGGVRLTSASMRRGRRASTSSGSGAGWSDAGVVIPWTSWLQTGDTRVIDENWFSMVKYLDAIEAANSDGLWEKESGFRLGIGFRRRDGRTRCWWRRRIGPMT